MKKIISLTLALVLILSLSVTAFAAENGIGNGGTASIDISATYQAGAAADDVVSVDISWGAMTFEYTDGAVGRWDPATHSYGPKANGTWSASDNDITVTNHSNVGVKAGFSYTQAVATVNGTFSAPELILASAEGTAVDAAPTGSVTLTLGGTMTESGKVGTVTVSIAQN